MRVVIPYPDGMMAVINFGNQPTQSPDQSAFVLDVEVFKDAQLESSDPSIWSLLDQMREIKNDIFFRSLTDHALEAYK